MINSVGIGLLRDLIVLRAAIPSSGCAPQDFWQPVQVPLYRQLTYTSKLKYKNKLNLFAPSLAGEFL